MNSKALFGLLILIISAKGDSSDIHALYNSAVSVESSELVQLSEDDSGLSPRECPA